MAQNKISRRSFLRGAGASATIAAASCMAPSAAACDIKSLWSMDLQILATSDTHGKFDPWDYAANKADASGSVAQQATAIKQCRTPEHAGGRCRRYHSGQLRRAVPEG